MTEKFANKVYDILVKVGSASESERNSFIFNHSEEVRYPTTEWRFCGSLGFGGKYRSRSNSVDCYREDQNPERLKVIDEINKQLRKLTSDCIN